jgi:hypothetical protein
VSRQATAAACRCRIPLTEVAEQVGATVEHISERAQRAGYAVLPDWAGRQALSVPDAAALVLWLRSRPD